MAQATQIWDARNPKGRVRPQLPVGEGRDRPDELDYIMGRGEITNGLGVLVSNSVLIC